MYKVRIQLVEPVENMSITLPTKYLVLVIRVPVTLPTRGSVLVKRVPVTLPVTGSACGNRAHVTLLIKGSMHTHVSKNIDKQSMLFVLGSRISLLVQLSINKYKQVYAL